MIVPVILSGGSGTRLWPLSRKKNPKQLLPLLGQNSLLQETILRLDSLEIEVADPIIVCSEAHESAIRAQLTAIGRSASLLVFEPEGRNTAPATAVALLLRQQVNRDDNACFLVLPADHAIGDTARFAAACNVAYAAAQAGSLVTFGIMPDRPETGYGYIERGEGQGRDCFRVKTFVEKPDADLAERYLESGKYFWNSGMFMFDGPTFLQEMGRYAGEMLDSCRSAVDEATIKNDAAILGRESFLATTSDSIDYAVMEHTDKAVVVPLDAAWSDVGSWASLYEACNQNGDGNVEIGNTLTLDSQASYVRSDGRLVVGVGLEGMLVVDTPDAVLVMPKERAQDVKEIVERLKSADREDLL